MIDSFVIFKDEIFKAFLETIDMLIVAMIFSLIIGIILSLVLYSTKKEGVYENKIIHITLSTIINIIRSIPFILFIIVIIPLNRFLVGTGFGVNASKIPLSLIGIATFARLSEQSFLEINNEMYETAYSLGSNKIQFFKYFLIKEARSSLVLSFTSTTISLISYSTVMGIIGGGGLGYLAISEGYNNFNYPLMWIIIIVIVLLVQSIQYFGSKLANYLNKN